MQTASVYRLLNDTLIYKSIKINFCDIARVSGTPDRMVCLHLQYYVSVAHLTDWCAHTFNITRVCRTSDRLVCLHLQYYACLSHI